MNINYYRQCISPKKDKKGLCSRKAMSNSLYCKQHTNIIRRQQGLQVFQSGKTRNERKIYNFLARNDLTGEKKELQELIRKAIREKNEHEQLQLRQQRQQQLREPQQQPRRQPREPQQQPRRQPLGKYVQNEKRLKSEDIDILSDCRKISKQKYKKLSERQKIIFKDKLIDKLIVVSHFNESDRDYLRKRNTKFICDRFKESIENNNDMIGVIARLYFDDLPSQE